MTDPFDVLEVVLVSGDSRDAALDPEMDTARYLETRDPALIKELPGLRARRFRITGICRPFLADSIDGMGAPSAKFTMAFSAGCHSFVDADGKEHKAKTHDGSFGQRMADPAWLEQVADEVGQAGIYELGMVASWRAALPKARRAR